MIKTSGAHVVIQGGTAEANRLADLLPEALFVRPAGRRQSAGNKEFLTAELFASSSIQLVVDASHPFDTASHFRASQAAQKAGIAYLRLMRPGWTKTPMDHGVSVTKAQPLLRIIPQGARLFVATGREELDAFKPLQAHVFWRSVSDERVTLPLRNSHVLPAEGPFSVQGEMALFRKLRIDWLVVRNAGGQGAWPKIEAARRLGIRVAMIDRPRPLQGPVLGSVNEVMEWIETTL